MERLTYMHKENVFKPNGELAHTCERGWWLNGLDWYSVCENACPLYDEDAEGEPNCNDECPIRLAFAKLAAYEDAEEHGQIAILDERLALAISAGARAIENNKRLVGATYVYDVFCDSKELSYYEAANILRVAAEAALNKKGE